MKNNYRLLIILGSLSLAAAEAQVIPLPDPTLPAAAPTSSRTNTLSTTAGLTNSPAYHTPADRSTNTTTNSPEIVEQVVTNKPVWVPPEVIRGAPHHE